MDGKKSALAKACLEASLDLAEQAEESLSDTPEFETTAFFERRMKSVMKRTADGKYRRFSKRAKIIFVAAIILVSTLIYVGANKSDVQNSKPYTVTVYDNFSNVEHFESRSVFYYNYIADYSFTPEYVPDGYEICDEAENKSSYTLTFENSDGHKIYISKSAGGGISSINTQFYPYEELQIDGNWVIVYKCPNVGQDEYNALFYKDGMKYSINGILDKNELVNIVKTLN